MGSEYISASGWAVFLCKLAATLISSYGIKRNVRGRPGGMIGDGTVYGDRPGPSAQTRRQEGSLARWRAQHQRCMR